MIASCGSPGPVCMSQCNDWIACGPSATLQSAVAMAAAAAAAHLLPLMLPPTTSIKAVTH